MVLFTWRGLLGLSVAMAAGAWASQGALSLLCGLVVATGLVGRAWAALSLVRLTYRRTLSVGRAFPGETVTLVMTLDNRKPLPLNWVRAEESLPRAVVPADQPIGDGRVTGIGRLGFITPLGWYRTATWQCRLECRRRGYHLIGPARLLSGDVFGLFVQSRSLAGALPLIVYPRLYSLADLGLPSRHPFGDARDPSRLFDDSSRPSAIRDYSPDTPFKNIAWRASARQGRLQVKTFEPTVSLKTALFLAVDGFAREADAELFEVAISVAASLSDWLIDQRQSVSLFANGIRAPGDGAVAIGPGRGDDQRMSLLEALARLERKATSPFASFLDAHGADLRGRTTLCVVATGLSEAAVDRLEALGRFGHSVVVLIVGSGPMPADRLACRRIDGSHLSDVRS